MSKQGYVLLHRQITDNPLRSDKPFARGQARVDLILEVNHTDAKAYMNGSYIEIKRGETITSVKQLSERRGRSRTKTNRFLEGLVDERMIERKKDTQKTWIKVLAYDDYQDREKQKKHQKNIKKTSKKHQKNTNKEGIKNDKEGNNKKQIYSDCVALSVSEYDRLGVALGEELRQKYIVELNDYILSTGKKYKSHYHTILARARKNNDCASNVKTFRQEFGYGVPEYVETLSEPEKNKLQKRIKDSQQKTGAKRNLERMKKYIATLSDKS